MAYACPRFHQSALSLAIALAGISASYANPTAPTVVNGTVQMQGLGTGNLQITNTPGAIINWGGFSIGANELTRFNQQSSASAVLNRVTGGDPSTILGQLQSNGRVFLINPNGIVFGNGARVDVQSLVASTRNITDQDFLDGNYRFTRGTGPDFDLLVDGGAAITTTGSGGQIWLIARNVATNPGSLLNAPGGQIMLAAATKLSATSTRFEFLTDGNNSIQTLGELVAERGAASLMADSIAHGGQIRAQGKDGRSSNIWFVAKADIRLQNGSMLDVSGQDSTRGGDIIMAADHLIDIHHGATINADGGPEGGNGGIISVGNQAVVLGFNGPNIHAKARAAGASDGNLATGGRDGEALTVKQTLNFPGANQVTVLANGEFLVLWTTFELDEYAQRQAVFHYARHDHNGVLIANTEVTWRPEVSAPDSRYTQLTLLADGSVLATGGYYIYGDLSALVGRVFNAQGQPVGDAFFLNAAQGSRLSSISNITATADNGFVLSWHEWGRSDGNLHETTRIARFNPRTGVLSDAISIDNNAGLSTRPGSNLIGLKGSSDSWLTYYEYDPNATTNTYHWFMRPVHVDGSQGTAIALGDNLKSPQLLALQSGDFMLLYGEPGSDRPRMMGQIYSAAGQPQGAAFSTGMRADYVNTYINSLSQQADGSVLVAVSDGTDGSFRQRYALLQDLNSHTAPGIDTDNTPGSYGSSFATGEFGVDSFYAISGQSVLIYEKPPAAFTPSLEARAGYISSSSEFFDRNGNVSPGELVLVGDTSGGSTGGGNTGGSNTGGSETGGSSGNGGNNGGSNTGGGSSGNTGGGAQQPSSPAATTSLTSVTERLLELSTRPITAMSSQMTGPTSPATVSPMSAGATSNAMLYDTSRVRADYVRDVQGRVTGVSLARDTSPRLSDALARRTDSTVTVTPITRVRTQQQIDAERAAEEARQKREEWLDKMTANAIAAQQASKAALAEKTVRGPKLVNVDLTPHVTPDWQGEASSAGNPGQSLADWGGQALAGLGNLANGIGQALQGSAAATGALLQQGANVIGQTAQQAGQHLIQAATSAGQAVAKTAADLQPVNAGGAVLMRFQVANIQQALSRNDMNGVIAAGGGNLKLDQVGVIAAGGGNALPPAMATVIAAGGGNLSLNDAARVIAAGGGNLQPAQLKQVFAGVIAAGGGNVIAAGGGNVIAAGGGNVIAAGGGNLGNDRIAALAAGVIAAGGGNLSALDIARGASQVIAAGGGNLTAAQISNVYSGVIAAGGGNVIAAGGGNVIAAGGGNVIAAGGGNVIAAGGGNLGAAAIRHNASQVIAAGGGNVIAAGGGNVIAAGGGNVINAGGGNVIAAGGGNVIAAGGGNVINAGGGNVIAAGGGNILSNLGAN